jgi:hypothetical protein
MSGGHFEYKQYQIGSIADDIEQLIIDNDSDELDDYGYRKGCHFTKETVEEFKQALSVLRKAHIYAQCIDWLVSGDDGEDSFHRRLKNDLEKL